MICLKNRTFAVSQTTTLFQIVAFRELWFAWKIVLLQYRKQLTFVVIVLIHVVICLKNRTFAVSQTTRLTFNSARNSCDLLEKSYFCSIANNTLWIGLLTCTVVICLKNRTFAVSQTTRPRLCSHTFLLWFAWKIVLLQYRKQH